MFFSLTRKQDIVFSFAICYNNPIAPSETEYGLKARRGFLYDQCGKT